MRRHSEPTAYGKLDARTLGADSASETRTACKLAGVPSMLSVSVELLLGAGMFACCADDGAAASVEDRVVKSVDTPAECESNYKRARAEATN